LTKENLIRKNLIMTEEAQEAQICEGSQASSILEDHRKNKKKIVKTKTEDIDIQLGE